MWRFWQLAGHLEEGVALATEILAIPGAEMPTALRLRALDAVGGLHYWRGEQVAAQQRYREQLDLARRLGDPRSIAEALFNLSFPTAITDDVVGAQAMAEEARAIYRELGDDSRLARVDWSLASLAQLQGRSAAALPILERGLARFIADDDLPYAALAQGSIGWSYGNLGDMENAVRYGIRSLVAYHALGDVSTTALTLHGGAILLAVLGRIEEAATADGAADALSARYGVRPPAALEGVLFGSAAFVSASNAIHAPGNEDALARGARMTLDEAVDFLVRAADDWLATRGS
jgi:tetratricopeptide (TPR) repeat protein